MPPIVRVLCVVGTRPEAIKMAPLILALRRQPWVEVLVVATAQHRDMLDQVFSLFDIVPDIDLDIMRTDQSLTSLTADLLTGFGKVLEAERPDAVLAQGDTTTVMSAALACYYYGIRFGHVEAGLRTGDIYSPFPEEINRTFAGYLARWHFAPTEAARRNLLRAGIDSAAIHVTGNTVIDALFMACEKHSSDVIEPDSHRRLVLVTVHRRESYGAPIRSICSAVYRLAVKNPDTDWLFPVHPNPNVRSVVHERLKNCANVRLCSPLDYGSFVAAMKSAYLIITDSGGVQEEAPSLGKPVLVVRNETERPEAIASGVVRLVGTSEMNIVNATQHLLDDAQAWQEMARTVHLYGDGKAADRIVHCLGEYFGPIIE